MNLNKTKWDLDCDNHFREIRFQLDLHRESLKKKPDQIEQVDQTSHGILRNPICSTIKTLMIVRNAFVVLKFIGNLRIIAIQRKLL